MVSLLKICWGIEFICGEFRTTAQHFVLGGCSQAGCFGVCHESFIKSLWSNKKLNSGLKRGCVSIEKNIVFRIHFFDFMESNLYIFLYRY